MITLTTLERFMSSAGLIAILGTVALLLVGILRGLGRRAGRASGQLRPAQRSPWHYVIFTVGFILVCWLL